MITPLHVPSPRQKQGARACVRVHRHVVSISENLDPWIFLRGSCGPLVALWHDGVSGMQFAAYGRVAELRLSEREPGAMQTWCSTIAEQVGHDHGRRGLPLALGGWAFAAQGRARTSVRESAWRDWPHTWLVVPRLIVCAERGSGTKIVAHAHDPIAARSLARGAYRLAKEAAQSAAWLGDPLGSVRGGPSENPRRWSIDPGSRAAAHYRQSVGRALRDIASGALDKVVVARRVSLTAHGGRFDAPTMAARLREMHPHARVFALFDAASAFLGASPELLVAVDGRRLWSEAVAGTATAPRAGALMSSAKDRLEHAMVLAHLEHTLAPMCEELHADEAPSLLDAGPVAHLRTPVVGSLRSSRQSSLVGLLDVAEALHPTPALGGQPRARALRWLEENEPIERGWYGAPVGWIDDSGGGVLAVAIRSLLVKGTHAYAYAGAGIVSGSEPHREWLETEAKLETVLSSVCVSASRNLSRASEEARP